MAIGLDIRTEGGSLELLQDAATTFYITRQIHDLNNFESRNADYTKSIEIPEKSEGIIQNYDNAEQESHDQEEKKPE